MLWPCTGGGVWARMRSFIESLEKAGAVAMVLRMSTRPESCQPFLQRRIVVAGFCLLAGSAVFQFFGNATRGYIDTRSVFYWWGSQWFNPASQTEHGLLILLVAGWLLWRNLRTVDKNAGVECGCSAAVAMLAGLGLHVLGYAAQQTRLSIVALLVFVWGVITFAGGRRWARAAVFPLGFMMLAMPLDFLDSLGLGFKLRMAVVEATHGLMQWLGVETIRNGTQLFSPDGRYQYEVAAACSGVQSLVALVALALLVGYLSFRRWWLRTAVVALSLPYVFAGNVVRISAIVLAGQKFGQKAGERLHDWSGYLVFVVVLLLLLATVAVIKKCGLDARVSATSTHMPTAAHPTKKNTSWLITGSVVIVAIVVMVLTTRLDAMGGRSVAGVKLSADGVNPIELPTFLGTDWAGKPAEVTAIERETLPPDTGYSRKTYFALNDASQQVFVSVVLSGRDRTSIHRPEICLVGQGWSVEAQALHRFTETLPATVLRIRHEAVDANGRHVVVPALFAYWFVGANGPVATHRQMQWENAVERLVHWRADRWAYVVAQTTALDGEEAAMARLQAVIGPLEPVLAVRPQIAGSLSAQKKD